MSRPSKFIAQLFEILNTEKYQKIIHWVQNGKAFVIPKILDFQAIIMKENFQMKNFQSFLRQLGLYGFIMRKNEKNQKEYSHKQFIRNDGSQLCKIKRKIKSQSNSEGDFCSIAKQNAVLKQQLNILKEQQDLLSQQLRTQFIIQIDIAGKIHEIVEHYLSKYFTDSTKPHKLVWVSFLTILQGYKPDAGVIISKPLQEVLEPPTPTPLIYNTPVQFK